MISGTKMSISNEKSPNTVSMNIISFQIICMIILLRYVGNVITHQRSLPSSSNMFSQVSLMQLRKTLTLRRVGSFSSLIENFLWDQLQRFYLVCKQGCPKLRHTMGCLVKSMPSSWMLKQFHERVLKVLPNTRSTGNFDTVISFYCTFNSNIKFHIQISYINVTFIPYRNRLILLLLL